MDRFAAHVVATTVLTAALAAVPSALATPSTDASSMAAVATAVTKPSTAAAFRLPGTPSPVTSPAPTSPLSSSSSSPAPRPSESPSGEARTRPIPCADAHQIGGTTYVRWHSIVAFSVKQFYSPSCHTFYGYAFPWLQFRLLKVHFDLGMGVFDATHDAIDGARTFVAGAGGPDFWSSPVQVPRGTCTQGLAHVFFPDTETDTFTSKVCA